MSEVERRDGLFELPELYELVRDDPVLDEDVNADGLFWFDVDFLPCLLPVEEVEEAEREEVLVGLRVVDLEPDFVGDMIGWFNGWK